MAQLKILPIFGTRPEAIKMAPLVKALEQDGHFEVATTVTAQHRQMLDQVLELFGIEPRHDLNIMQAGQSLTDITARVLYGLKEILEAERPDLVLVHGDTTTTFAGSLAAYYQQIPVGHVEAGLRTYNKYSPYPEEMNRKLTGALADLHFAPTAVARQSLLREGVDPGRIVVTGNTVIDALLDTVGRSYHFSDPRLRRIGFSDRKVVLVTAHRRENLGEPMRNIFAAVREIVANHPEVEVVFPMHLNPKVRENALAILGGAARVHLIDPLDYQPFANLISQCYLVMTDSGGIQEEAPSLGKPVLVLRDTTERPEAVSAGTVRLVGTDRNAIIREANRLLDEPREYRRMSTAVNPYGDGRASARIVQAILHHFGCSAEPPEEFAAAPDASREKSGEPV
jgi:UDP-N-acetylglucosamine 2-epimerase (non-hydrolysing)